MAKNTSILLGEYFENFVNEKVSSGKYTSVSEVIRAALRLLEDEENKLIVLKQSINEEIESGIAQNFDPTAHLETLKANRKKNG